MAATPGIIQKFMVGGKFPVIARGNVNEVRKIIQPNHVTGLPPGWPKIYYVQKRSNLAENRTRRNVNVSDLGDGAYLYLIEYSPSTAKYHTVFVKVLNKLECGSRHFQLPSRNKSRVIVAAGELAKNGQKIRFNLESGTYTKNLMKMTNLSQTAYTNLVKNALKRKVTFTKNILVPQIPACLQNVKEASATFNWGQNRTPAVRKALEKAGLSPSARAENLIRNLKKKSSVNRPLTASSRKRKSVK